MDNMKECVKMTLDEMFNEINRTTEETHLFHDTYIVLLEVKYSYLEKPEVFASILWHDDKFQSCIEEFMPKGFMWYDDWYHCCKKENVKVLRYADLDHVFMKAADTDPVFKESEEEDGKKA